MRYDLTIANNTRGQRNDTWFRKEVQKHVPYTSREFLDVIWEKNVEKGKRKRGTGTDEDKVRQLIKNTLVKGKKGA
jgi:hypothetical protein